MLTDDELDFDDFGDLGEVEGPELTNEELEKQLELEFDLENNFTESNSPSATDVEPGEALSTNDPPKEEEQQKSITTESTLNKPSSSSSLQHQKPYPNKYNPRVNNAFYPNQFNFMPNVMAMNQMYMQQFAPFSNRIYVNPKFNQATPQQMMQRQYMEMEAQRMMMMQQQFQQQPNMDELDRKRRETAEMMRKRKESREQAGEKRKRPELSPTEERAPKRQELPLSPAGGISIKGMAAARGIRTLSTPSPRPTVRSTHEDIKSRLQAPRKPDILSRLSQPGSRPSEQVMSTPVPISTSGKSNTVVIQGFDDSVQQRDIVSMAKTMPGGYQDIQFDRQSKQAIVKFSTVETAVTFRRKYNRSQMGDKHIVVAFQK
ncbi:hypothetical protein EDC96DRAFT_516718 [Choanephora cucurbitarum]|nr:hypothetical protein EDC96DRAFT_516718 [Choanephora cucurbitarum]